MKANHNGKTHGCASQPVGINIRKIVRDHARPKSRSIMKANYNGKLQQQVMIPPHRILVNAAYATRNKKWDMELAGTFYLAGFNGGDYNVQASLKRLIGQKLGYLTLGFQNVNRTPSFIHDDRSNFKKFNIGNSNFIKENTTIASAVY